jgi:hypothetical protein
MKNLFVTKGIYSTNDQLNYIMNAPASEHAALKATLYAKAAQSTEQVTTPIADYLKEYDDKLLVFGNTSPGKIIRTFIEGE